MGDILFPVDLDTQTIEMLVRNNSLTVIPPRIGLYTKLTYLNLSYNLINVIADEIGNLMHLDDLNLSRNDIVSLPNTIGNLHALKRLNIRSNKLKTIPDTICNIGPSLQLLDISKNRLCSLPENIGFLTNLKRLLLYSNHLDTLPESVGQLHRLEHLDVGVNSLTTLPNLNNLKSLLMCEVNHNQLTCIHNVCGIRSVERLIASHNNLVELPENIHNLINVSILMIDDNKDVRRFPKCIGSLKKLGTLVWGGCGIDSFPASMCKLINLHSIYFHHFYPVCGEHKNPIIYPPIFRLAIPPQHADKFDIAPLYWHTRYHHRFPKSFQEMVLAFVACNRLGTKPYLPPEMIWEILHHIEYDAPQRHQQFRLIARNHLVFL